MYKDFSPVLIFTLLGIALAGLPFVIQSLISPKQNKTGDKLMSYECGEIPEGSAWVQFNIRFYIVALIFIIFEVEVVFLFPWAVVYKEIGLVAFIEMFIFVMILVLGFAYVWVKGDLNWVKMQLKYAEGRYAHLKIKQE